MLGHGHAIALAADHAPALWAGVGAVADHLHGDEMRQDLVPQGAGIEPAGIDAGLGPALELPAEHGAVEQEPQAQAQLVGALAGARGDLPDHGDVVVGGVQAAARLGDGALGLVQRIDAAGRDFLDIVAGPGSAA